MICRTSSPGRRVASLPYAKHNARLAPTRDNMTTATQGQSAQHILHRAGQGVLPTDAEALSLASFADTRALADVAAALRDQGFLNLVTYSKKIFIPLTHLCRDVCHYCTFAQTPSKLDNPYMELDAVLEVARHGAEMGCKEALFTLGEKPELRYRAARDWLAGHGYSTTLAVPARRREGRVRRDRAAAAS